MENYREKGAKLFNSHSLSHPSAFWKSHQSKPLK